MEPQVKKRNGEIFVYQHEGWYKEIKGIGIGTSKGNGGNIEIDSIFSLFRTWRHGSPKRACIDNENISGWI